MVQLKTEGQHAYLVGFDRFINFNGPSLHWSWHHICL